MGVFFILLITLAISPFLCGVISFYVLNKFYNNNFNSIVALLFLGLSLGYLNILKVPASDQLNYIEIFNNVKLYNFWNYIQNSKKEIIYITLNYGLYHLFGGNFNLFLMFVTGISYAFIFYAIRIFDKNLNLGKESFLLAFIVAVFFPNLFSISAHLIRQFLAGSLILVFITKNIFEGNKKSLPFFIAACLIHSSSFFFAIVFVPFLNKKLSLIKISAVSFFILLIFYILERYSFFFEKLPLVGYALSRFINRENAVWETEELGFLSILIQGVVILLLIRGILAKNTYNNTSLPKLVYTTFFLIFFILLNYNNTEIATRFNFYIYLLFPFSIYFTYDVFKIKSIGLSKIVNILISSVFIYWFIYKLNNGRWEYLNLEKFFLIY